MSENYRKARKQSWLDRVIAIHNFHVEQLRIDSQWRIEDTSRELNRSNGSVSQDIMLASFLKTHENKIRSFKLRTAALEWALEKKREMARTEVSN